ncbi:serine/threonine-protein kinase [Nannocystaceae bacterium ST9]
MRRLLDAIGLGRDREGRDESGRVIAHRYRLQSLIGKCGAGQRYLGLDEASEAQVLILVLPASLASPQTAAWLSRLDVSFGDLRILRPRAFGVDEGRPYTVIDAVEGEPLDRVLARGVPPWPVVFELLEELCDMLAAAHKRGLHHGCLEPSRIYLGTGGPWLLDFGLASALARSDTRSKAGGFAMPGSPEYVAPELLDGRPPSASADLYSLAVTLWEMVAGAPPFVGELGQIVEGHRSQPIPELVRRADAPVEIEALLDIALSKQPDDRFNDTRELVEALRGIQASSSGVWSLSSLNADASTPGANLAPTTELGAMLRTLSVVELWATRELIDKLLEARGAKS